MLTATSQRVYPRRDIEILAKDQRSRALGTSDPHSPKLSCRLFSRHDESIDSDEFAYHLQEHRHSFVRKNAVFTTWTIYQAHDHLIPDAPELLETFLAAESDITCKRNAFVALCSIDHAAGVNYLLNMSESVDSLDELMQMAVIELIRSDAKSDSSNRAKWIRIVFSLLNSSSSAVKYEAATSLTSLTQNPAAVKAAAAAFAQLLVKEADNNVKLIVLDRIDTLREKFPHVLDPLVMDILKVLSR